MSSKFATFAHYLIKDLALDTPLLLIFTLLGSLALCLYGMKIMSQGLLQIAGAHMRASLRAISQHRLSSFFTGAWITSLIQSSSAMTVMTASLVNAGLLDLNQSIAITMGANVGTTVTAWIIALFGYAYPMGVWAIAGVCLAMPFFYPGLSRYKSWGDVFLGIALMLLGFTTFISLLPSGHDSLLHQLLLSLQGMGILSILLYLLLGITFTLLFHSSSATILIAMVLTATGWVPFSLAAALVIGDNVGTTLTAVWAARKASISARRAAYSHLFFNMVGLVWALPLVVEAERLVGSVLVDGGDGQGTRLAFAVALYHTLFNLVTAVLLIGFVPQCNKLLCRFLPVPEEADDEFHLSFISGGILSTAELAVEEARKETVSFGERCQRMLALTNEFMHMPTVGDAHSHAFSRIEKYEKITDRLEMEICRFLQSLDLSTVSPHTLGRVRAIYREVDELESIGDACYSLARAVIRRRDHGLKFIPMQQQNIDRMMEETQRLMDLMVRLMPKTELTQVDMNRAYAQEDAINDLRGYLREQNIGNVQSEYYSYQSGVIYMDIVNGLEKIGDFIINVLEAQSEQMHVEHFSDELIGN